MYDNRAMLFADLGLSRRLERAEGHACAQFAESRRRVYPASGAMWMECAGAYAVFDGVDSPLTQSFGLGIFEELAPTSLDVIERFFLDRGASVLHEVSPLAGVAALDLLCARQYRPIEISNVLYRAVEKPPASDQGNIRVRVTGPAEAQLWSSISRKGWTHEHPELSDFLLKVGAISSAREHSVCFLAEVDDRPGAAGVLCMHNGVALFGGSATIPELRRRGLQAALLEERMRYAFDQGCNLAMMVAEAGSNSQRNAERKGFRMAYTRTKWRLFREPRGR
jgi:GNAT superfamily N-acetyltransferase